ncbi:MAG TPA: arginyltransferase [Phycisphaerae bacterium]|nr:arginyltransferase [Phycisphaerae bacterium]
MHRADFTLHLPLLAGPAHPCSYLPDRTAINEFTVAGRLSGAEYHALMDRGFRRSGDVVYRPACPGCRECIPIRVPVGDFAPSRSHRRVLRKNRDVEITVASPRLSDEKWQVYASYLAAMHDGTMSDDREGLEEFLYQSPTSTLEMVYRIEGKVVAAGIVDVCPEALSSVYFYFDPLHARRSLGIFGALKEIEECRRRQIPYWYIGYYIRDCRRMNYKAQFQPCELLDENGHWRRS